MKLLVTLFYIFYTSITVFAGEKKMTPTNQVSVVKFENGLTTLRVGVCPEDAPVEVGIKFTASSSPNDLTFADLQVLTPMIQCYANTYRDVVVNLDKLIKEKVEQDSIISSSVLMRTLPLRLEVQNFNHY
ncbi:MAG: hypothetical protein Q7U04_04925 [Bacteriovorax sp.]|nr:hypothetical protein [Bacteriovorax sp.]